MANQSINRNTRHATVGETVIIRNHLSSSTSILPYLGPEQVIWQHSPILPSYVLTGSVLSETTRSSLILILMLGLSFAMFWSAFRSLAACARGDTEAVSWTDEDPIIAKMNEFKLGSAWSILVRKTGAKHVSKLILDHVIMEVSWGLVKKRNGNLARLLSLDD